MAKRGSITIVYYCPMRSNHSRELYLSNTTSYPGTKGGGGNFNDLQKTIHFQNLHFPPQKTCSNNYNTSFIFVQSLPLWLTPTHRASPGNLLKENLILATKAHRNDIGKFS